MPSQTTGISRPLALMQLEENDHITPKRKAFFPKEKSLLYPQSGREERVE